MRSSESCSPKKDSTIVTPLLFGCGGNSTGAMRGMGPIIPDGRARYQADGAGLVDEYDMSSLTCAS
jgi:hypothetical protein